MTAVTVRITATDAGPSTIRNTAEEDPSTADTSREDTVNRPGTPMDGDRRTVRSTDSTLTTGTMTKRRIIMSLQGITAMILRGMGPAAAGSIAVRRSGRNRAEVTIRAGSNEVPPNMVLITIMTMAQAGTDIKMMGQAQKATRWTGSEPKDQSLSAEV